MKNSAVKTLVQAQYNLTGEHNIDVEFLRVVANVYSYRVIITTKDECLELLIDVNSTVKSISDRSYLVNIN